MTRLASSLFLAAAAAALAFVALCPGQAMGLLSGLVDAGHVSPRMAGLACAAYLLAAGPVGCLVLAMVAAGKSLLVAFDA